MITAKLLEGYAKAEHLDCGTYVPETGEWPGYPDLIAIQEGRLSAYVAISSPTEVVLLAEAVEPLLRVMSIVWVFTVHCAAQDALGVLPNGAGLAVVKEDQSVSLVRAAGLFNPSINHWIDAMSDAERAALNLDAGLGASPSQLATIGTDRHGEFNFRLMVTDVLGRRCSSPPLARAEIDPLEVLQAVRRNLNQIQVMRGFQ